MNVIFYQKADGSSPVANFLDALDDKMRAKVIRSLKLLEAKGHLLRAPDSKELTDGIMELRTTFAGNISRVLYFFIVGNTAIVTNGFIKKRKRLPLRKSNVLKHIVLTIKGGIRHVDFERIP